MVYNIVVNLYGGIMTISTLKTEQKSINRINELIDKIPTAHSNISQNDKSISWDGTIDFYKNASIEKKENYLFSIDVQVKGRTTPKKKLTDKQKFDVQIVDLENYLKKDGTLLLLVEFKNNSEDFKIYYIDLLPYKINNLLKQVNGKNKKVSVNLFEVKNAKDFEKICHNFQKNKEQQKRMIFNVRDENNINMENVTLTKFSVWENDLKNFKPENLVGTYQYFYNYDSNNFPISVNYAMIYNMIKKIPVIISSSDKTIQYNDMELITSVNKELFVFGKSFNIDYTNHTFNITIKGTLKERINAIKFSIQLLEKNFFYVNDKKFVLTDFDRKEQKKFEELLEKYKELEKVLQKHNIYEDIDLDKWTEKDIDEFNIWMDAIENNHELILKSETSLIGCKKFGTIKISIMATLISDHKFKIKTIWNNNMAFKYAFKYDCNGMELHSNNLFLNLIAEAYEADDINYDEMIKVFDNYSLSDDEYTLMNFQVLDVLKAYDITRNEKLLDYAYYLSKILLKNKSKDYDIHYINYCQILKRQEMLTDEYKEKLITIRDNSNQPEIKLSCCLLLDSFLEANLILKNMSEDNIKIFKDYPIAKFLK